jgi:hypothetical protein
MVVQWLMFLLKISHGYFLRDLMVIQWDLMLFNCCLMGFTGILYIDMVIQWGIALWLFYMAMEMAHLIYVDLLYYN